VQTSHSQSLYCLGTSEDRLLLSAKNVAREWTLVCDHIRFGLLLLLILIVLNIISNTISNVFNFLNTGSVSC